jgi:DNA-binding CsgD family transcriptional regulator
MAGATATAVAEEKLIGRAAELEAVDAFLGGGAARVLVLEGEAGIGKTALWRAGIQAAHERGFDVLRARPATAEASLTLSGLHDLLDGVPPRFKARLPEVQQRALAAALGEEAPAGSSSDAGVLGVAVLRLVGTVAAERPVLLAIDDLQWLDEATGALLVYALRRAGDAPIRLLATCRARAGAALPFALQDSIDPASLARLAVGPLSEGAIRRLLRVRLGLSLSRIQAHAVYSASDGNPFFALELGRAGIETDGWGALLLPRSLYELLDLRLGDLPSATRDSLLYVAALADPTVRALELAGVSGGLDHALASGVLELEGERIRFAHPLMSSASRSIAGDEQRREVHRVLAETAEDPEQRALHLAAVAEPPDVPVSRLLEEAGRNALRRGAPARASVLFDEARRLAPALPVDDWARLAALAVEAHVAAGHWDDVDELVEAARLRLPAGPERGAILVASADLRPGLDLLLRQVVSDAGETAAGVRARLGLTEQSALAGRWSESIEVATEAEALARSLGDRGLLGVALAYLGGMKLLDSRLEGIYEIDASIAIEDELGGLPGSVFQSPRMWLASARLWSGDVDSGRAILQKQLSTAADRGDEMSVFQLRQILILLELRAGELAAARTLAEEELEQIETLGYGYGRPILSSALACLEAWEGNLERARELGDAALEALTPVGDRLWSTHAHASLLLADVCAGDGPSGLAHAESIEQALAGRPECWWSYHQANELEALVLAGEHERALARADALRRAGRANALSRFLAWAERGEGLVRLARGEPAAALSSFESALRYHDGFVGPLERARTLLAYGHALRLERHRSAARAALDEALRAFDLAGAARFARATREEMAHLGGRAPANGRRLTGAEERIARLVAGGLSNKDAAAELYLSVSTVEAALTRVYRKLGVSSRSQLAGLLAGDAPHD